VHQAHELAIGWLCASIETSAQAAGVRVRTEREMRQRETAIRREGLPPRYRLDLHGAPHGQRTRWPDLALERDGRPLRAIELEFTQKSDERLERIIDGYYDGPYRDVLYLTADPTLAAKLARIIHDQRHGPLGPRTRVTITVAAWPRASAQTRAAVTARVLEGQDGSSEAG
jgi:hypothetical protein